MKNLKRIFAVLLSIIIIAGSLVIPVAAGDSESEAIVARIYIAHKARYLNFSGHTWIYIENLSDHELTVGAYPLKKGKGVSIGTYGYQISSGRGLYYNVEAYRYRNDDADDSIYVSKDLTQSQFDKVSKKIRRSGTWDYTLNCAFGAIRIWNASFGKPMVYVLIPPLHQLQILMKPSHQKGLKMQEPKTNEVFKQVGRGDKATIVPADPKVPD